MPTVKNVFDSVNDFPTLLKLILTETKLYAMQKGIVFDTNEDELLAFLGITIIMSIHKLPSTRLYWSTNPVFTVPVVSNVMTRDRYEEIRSLLHFMDNNKQPKRDNPNYDKAYKVRSVINHFNKTFSETMRATKSQAIDEHMIRFKGQNSMKQYMKNKPISWGFKLWCRCDTETGYLFQFDIYTGKKTNKQIGLGESVVYQLCEPLYGLDCEVYFDNFFNSPTLQLELLRKNLKACGTVRSNRKHTPTGFPSDKKMKRGDIVSKVSNGVYCTKWMDNRAVFMCTNFISHLIETQVKRRQSGSANKINIPCPLVIQKYNKGMGGVDLMDQKKVYYEINRKSKFKFYLRIFFDIFDLGINNAFIVYSKIATQLQDTQAMSMSLLEYRAELAKQLINDFTSRQRVYESQKLGSRGQCKYKRKTPVHAMQKVETRKRCKICTAKGIYSRTNTVCTTCNIPLCFTNTRNCFAIHHTEI